MLCHCILKAIIKDMIWNITNIRLCKNYTKVTRGDAVHSECSGIVVYGVGEIVFGAK